MDWNFLLPELTGRGKNSENLTLLIYGNGGDGNENLLESRS